MAVCTKEICRDLLEPHSCVSTLPPGTKSTTLTFLTGPACRYQKCMSCVCPTFFQLFLSQWDTTSLLHFKCEPRVEYFGFRLSAILLPLSGECWDKRPEPPPFSGAHLPSEEATVKNTESSMLTLSESAPAEVGSISLIPSEADCVLLSGHSDCNLLPPPLPLSEA